MLSLAITNKDSLRLALLLQFNKEEVCKAVVANVFGDVSPLQSAVYHKYFEGVQLLLDAGASPEAIHSHIDPPLVVSCFQGTQDITQILLTAGADIHKVDRDGWSPLMAAVHSNLLNVVRYFLLNGVDIENKSSYGDTALLVACTQKNRCPEMIDLLLEHGANIYVSNAWGESPNQYLQ